MLGLATYGVAMDILYFPRVGRMHLLLTQVAIVSSDREDDVGEDDAMDEDDEEDIVSITFPNDST